MADKKPANQPLGGTAIKPEGWDRTGMEALKYFLYNPKTGEIMSRTPKSWLLITVFYLIYYSCLAAFWIACLNIFFLTLPDAQPRWTLGGSIIGTNPGVGVRPKNSDKKIDSSIFTFDITDSSTKPTNDKGEGETNADWVKRMDIFLEAYNNKTGLIDCPDKTENPGKCVFDTTQMKDWCGENYGYLPSGGAITPCIFIKLNKIFNWEPNGLIKKDLGKYPEMSEKLRKAIEDNTDVYKATTKDPETGEDTENEHVHNIYVDCFGRYPADKESVQLEFYPATQNLPLKYFPYTGGNYHSPMVAVKVTPGEKAKGQLLHIECRAYFHGVEHSTKEKAGLALFEVYIHKGEKEE